MTQLRYSGRTLLWLFVASLLPRLALSAIHLLYQVPPNLDLPVPGLYSIRLYADFEGYYVGQLYYAAHGLLPYRDFAYNFPPFFLYTLLPFYVIGGSNAAAIPIVLADVLTPPALYLLVRGYASNRIALLVGLAYAFSPLMLLYEGYQWLGDQPMTFFVVLSLYFLQRNKLIASSIGMGVAELFRQQALLVLPIYAIWLLRGEGRRGLSYVVVALGVIVLGSAPFLILTPGPFIGSVYYIPLYGHVAPYPNPSIITGVVRNLTINFCVPFSSNSVGAMFSCNYGSSPYTTFLPYPSPLLTIVNNLSIFLRLPLALLVLPILYVARRKSNWLLLASSYAAAISVTIFTIFVHQELRYYYLLFYCLFLACSTTRSSLAIAIGFSFLTLIIPEVTVQDLLPFLAILTMVLVQEVEGLRGGGSESQGPFTKFLASIQNPSRFEAIVTKLDPRKSRDNKLGMDYKFMSEFHNH